MIDVSPQIALLVMFFSLLVLLFTGLPIAFALGGIGVMSIILLWGPEALSIAASSALAVMEFYTLVAIPFFVFMAMILQGSGVAEDLFRSMRLWVGRIPGGLAIGVVFTCTIIAAMSGLTATGLFTMGILGIPVMMRLGYNKLMITGPIMVGSGLGILIPPSITFIVYGALAEVSIGKLFSGGVVPGLILSVMYMIYIGVRCHFQPHLGPPLPPEERVGLREKILSLKSIFLPVVLVMACLGTLFLGIASAAEAAAAGAVGAILCAAIYRKLNWKMIKDATYETFKISLMCGWLLIGAFVFKAVFTGVGGPTLAREFVTGLAVSPIVIILMMQLSYVFLGCFIDDMSMMLITLPVYVPIVVGFGYDPIWFGVLFLINIQIAYLTPPYGFATFYMKSITPPEITTVDMYRSIIPFIPLQVICLMMVTFFPQLALWLPDLIFGLI